jgi:hypothetical protein
MPFKNFESELLADLVDIKVLQKILILKIQK